MGTEKNPDEYPNADKDEEVKDRQNAEQEAERAERNRRLGTGGVKKDD